MNCLKSIRTRTRNNEDTNKFNADDKSIHHQLCSINDLQNGQMKEFTITTTQISTNILLIRQNDKFYAYSNKCCHYKLPLIKGLIKCAKYMKLFKRD